MRNGQPHFWDLFIPMTALLALAPLSGAMPQRSQPVVPSNYVADSLYRLQENVDQLRHGQNNHESELKEMGEKFENFDSIIDSLRRQLNESNKIQKENFTASKSDIETKLGNLELVIRSAVADLRQLKDHANETSSVMTQYQQRLSEIGNANELQAQQIEHLQNALKMLTEFLQGKENEVSATKIYSVKSGDSLEKIAAAHQTTIKALKELNGLTSDRIIINQKLKLPDRP